MKPVTPSFPRAFAAALAFVLATGFVLAADKQDGKKADGKQAPDAKKKGADPKAAGKDATPPTNAIPLVVVFPKAVFNTALDTGRDPFFPASKRRFPKPPEIKPPPVIRPPTNAVVRIPEAPVPPPPGITTNAAPVAPSAPVPPPPDLVGGANLSLRGISGSKTRRFAVVHTGAKGYTFTKNEEMLIRLPNDKQLKVRCLDIGERSARFHIEGETEPKELFLREGL